MGEWRVEMSAVISGGTRPAASRVVPWGPRRPRGTWRRVANLWGYLWLLMQRPVLNCCVQSEERNMFSLMNVWRRYGGECGFAFEFHTCDQSSWGEHYKYFFIKKINMFYVVLKLDFGFGCGCTQRIFLNKIMTIVRIVLFCPHLKYFQFTVRKPGKHENSPT